MKFAPRTSAPVRFAPVSVAPSKFAFVRLAWLKLALVSVAVHRRFALREVLAGEVRARQIVAAQSDSGQIVGLVAGRRVELGGRDAVPIAVTGLPDRNCAPAHSASGEVRASQRGAIEGRIREVGLAEVAHWSAWRIEVRIGEVLVGEIHARKVVASKLIPVKSWAW